MVAEPPARPRFEPTRLSPAELLQSMPPQFKWELFLQLASDLAAEHPDWDSIELESEADGGRQGILIFRHSSAAQADAMYCSLDANTRRALMKPYLDFDWDDVLTDEEILAIGSPTNP